MSERAILRCVHGLEWVAAAELTRRLPGVVPAFSRRELRVSLPELDPWLLSLRTVDDAFVEVGRLDPLRSPTELAGLGDSVLSLPWRRQVDAIAALRAVSPRPTLDVVGSVEGRHGYSRFDLERAVGPPLAAHLGGRYLARTAQGREPGEADLTARLFARQDGVTAALRVAERPLHRRPYKLAVGPGTLHPPVAAALALLGEPARGERLLDPFCGDGTIVVETALVSSGVAITGTDLDPARLEGARQNAARAGVTIDFAPADAGSSERFERPVDVVLTNPPWNLAVDARGSLRGSLAAFWRRLPDMLDGQGRIGTITDVELDVPSVLRRLGFSLSLASQVRLAGRLCHLCLAAATGSEAQLPSDVAAWRERAIAAGVATEEGFG